MVFIVRQEDFQEVSPWLFYWDVRRISRGRLRGFYCEATRISRGRIYIIFDSAVRRISKGSLYGIFITRRVEFQERTSMALNVGRKEFQEGAAAYMLICH